MQHVALDRTGPHDGGLDGEIVERARLEERLLRHLRPVLDLEHADRIRPRQHVVDGGILGRDGGETERRSSYPSPACGGGEGGGFFLFFSPPPFSRGGGGGGGLLSQAQWR